MLDRRLRDAARSYFIRARAVGFNVRDVAHRRFGDALQRIAGKKGLMTGDEDVWKG